LRVRGFALKQQPLSGDQLKGTLTVLDGVETEVLDEPYAVRVVPVKWQHRVQRAMRRPLYRYQVQGAAWLAWSLAQGKGGILGDDPGLGKTAQAIAAVVALQLWPCIVVCPASLKEQWAREFAYSAAAPAVTILDGWMSAFELTEVVIVNYELLRTRIAQLWQLGAKVIIFDEIQALKNPRPKSERHRANVGTLLGHHVGLTVGLTGTPIMNKGPELWRLLHIIDQEKWPDYDQFYERYCKRPPKPIDAKHVVTTVGRIERLEELKARVAPLLLRRAKAQVLPDLPPKSRRSILVRLGPEEWWHYQQAEKDVVSWLRSIGEMRRASSAERSKGISKMRMLRRIAGLGKVRRAAVQYLRMWFSRELVEPLVIFGYHRDVMLGLYQICVALGLRTTGIGGGEPMSKRQRKIDMFMAGDADVFLAPILAGGVGLNLQRASEALFIERVFSPSQQTQAEDRLHRLGQSRPVTITYLDAVGTVDERIKEVLDAKERLVSAVVDGLVGHERETADVASQVAELLAAGTSADSST
jgi:SNF2 family DNA or RNA helicase